MPDDQSLSFTLPKILTRVTSIPLHTPYNVIKPFVTIPVSPLISRGENGQNSLAREIEGKLCAPSVKPSIKPVHPPHRSSILSSLRSLRVRPPTRHPPRTPRRFYINHSADAFNRSPVKHYIHGLDREARKAAIAWLARGFDVQQGRARVTSIVRPLPGTMGHGTSFIRLQLHEINGNENRDPSATREGRGNVCARAASLARLRRCSVNGTLVFHCLLRGRIPCDLD